MRKWTPFLISATLTSLFFIDFCNWFYQCGCQSLWAARDAHCNIHQPAPPHCPVCSFGWPGYMAVWLAWLAPQVLVTLRAGRWRVVWLILVTPLAGLAIMGALGWATGYWSAR